MKPISRILWTLLLIITLPFYGCDNSNDEPIVDPPVVIVPPIEKSTMKPAIKSVSKKSTTGKSAVVTKRVKQTIKYYTPTNTNIRKWSSNLTSDYASLETDSPFDQAEIALNEDKPVYLITNYEYDSEGRLSKISYPTHPTATWYNEYSDVNITYSAGVKNQVTKFSFWGFEYEVVYNSNGLASELWLDGKKSISYTYDSMLRVTQFSSYNEDGSVAQSKRIDYISDSKYDVYSGPSVGNETNYATGFEYTKDAPGIYNLEPLFMLSDVYGKIMHLHITKIYLNNHLVGATPKYFYDADGYLMKMDEGGVNDLSSITRYIYE